MSAAVNLPHFSELGLDLPELIALDIDGTVVPFDGNVEEHVADAVARIREAGVTVVLATGRSLSTTAPVARTLGLDGWLVCSNGAILATADPEGVVEAITFNPRTMLERLLPLLPGAMFAVEDVDGIFHATRQFRAGALGMQVKVVPVEHLLDVEAVRIVVHSDEHMENGFAGVVADMGLESVTFGVGDIAWMDVGPLGVNKASALRDVCTRLDINPVRTLAIGDGQNDIEMLQWAGTGIAMGGSPDEVLPYADAVTSAVPGDGVAEVIDYLLR